MYKLIIFLLFIFALAACKSETNKNTVAVNKLDTTWLGSIIKQSDTSYSKPYKRTDFVTAFFYINKKDSIICQVMKDSSQQIRQVLISTKNSKTHFSQYYANGQLIADIPLNKYGQNDGMATYYYEDGKIKTKGKFKNSLYAGTWENYDENGHILVPTKYDENGNIIP
jgi:hypothetical protein